MLAFGSVAAMADATVSAWGRGADSSAAGMESSLAAAALSSSPSQDKSVDFLHSTQSVVNKVRLPIYMYYWGKIYTYKLDRTTVTVRVPSMLAMSTSLA
jgi:tetrahydromethanopterin S-methyltransferase subunit D